MPVAAPSTVPAAAPSTVGNTNSDVRKSKNHECAGCGKVHYHAAAAVTCCPFQHVADALSSELAARFSLPELAAVRMHLGIEYVGVKVNDPFTAKVVFTNKIACDSWNRQFEVYNCVDYRVPTDQLAGKVDAWKHSCTAHCSRAGTSRQGTRKDRHTTRKMEPSNCSCQSCLRFIYSKDCRVTVFINAKHSHEIGLEGLRYIRLSEELVSEVTRRITDQVADVAIVRGIHLFSLIYFSR